MNASDKAIGPPTWIKCEQGSDEWKRARLGKITGSRFKDVMTKGRAGDVFGKVASGYAIDILCERLTKEPQDEIKAKQLEWGKLHEASARLEYFMATSHHVENVGFAISGEYPDVGASVDGLVGDDGCLEIKCPFNSKIHLLNLQSSVVPSDYIWQVQGGPWVTQRKWCDFVSYDPRMPEDYRLSIIRVNRDEKLIAQLEERIVLFRNLIKETEDRFANQIESKASKRLG